MDNRVTKKRAALHFEYDWLIYLLIIALVIFATYMVFMQINITRDFERVDVFFACYSHGSEDIGDEFMSDLGSRGDNVIREVNLNYNSPTNEYYDTLLTSSGFTADVLVVRKSDMERYGSWFLELDDYALNQIFGDNTELRDGADYFEYTPGENPTDEEKALAGRKYGIRVDNLKKINNAAVENPQFYFDLSKYSNGYTEEELAQYHTLNVGDRNADVLALRKRLYELGYYAKPNENALYTESTADVVRMFQQDCGLEETGTADPYTQALLFDDRMLAREGSAQEVTYLQNKAQPLYIQRAEITSYSFYGSVQVSVRNNTSGKLTAFGLKIIPNMSDGELVDMADTFAEQIEKEYNLDSIAVARGNSYSDFETNGKAPLYNDPDDYEEPEIGEVYIYPHHFQVSYKQYFTGAQVAVSWYRAAGRNVYVDDDQMVFVSVGKGTDELMTYTLPIAISDSQREEARKWEMGIVARYVLPVYQDYYNLPQGAYLRSVEEGSPAQEAGLQEGDIIVGIGEQTILGDMTLRLSRASFAPGDIQTVYFWRDGQYYTTEMMRPENG